MKKKTYGNGDLIDIGENERVAIDFRFGDGRRLRCGRIAGIGEELFVLVVVLVDVDALGLHELGTLLVDQVHHLFALLLHQRRRRRSKSAKIQFNY